MRFLLAPFVAAALLAPAAVAAEKPGSLLLFPQFDNARGGLTLLTVTNLNGDMTQVGNLFAGTVDVEFVYVNAASCQEFNRTRRLTPKDTITVVAAYDNPNAARGYAYAFAKNPTTGRAIKFDWLMGSSTILQDPIVTEVEPWVFQAGAALAHGDQTDVDSDGRRDLNGVEYAQAPDQLHVPRFWTPASGSDGLLTLISLAPTQFTSIVDFLVYNDNEEVFSAQYSFRCWTRVPLLQISNVFSQQFLSSTNHNPNEVAGLSGVSSAPETGWFTMDGSVAFSIAAQIQDPPFLAWYLDHVVAIAPVGSLLPFVTGEQANGDLVYQSPFPDPN